LPRYLHWYFFSFGPRLSVPDGDSIETSANHSERLS
jgi:hypothetical protein